jgi:hypothetical protein
MAILRSLPGISVTMHTGKGQLTEYPDDEPEHVEGLQVSQDRVVSNYVEGESGELFWFQLRVDKPYDSHSSHPLSFRFELNGERLTSGEGYCPKKNRNQAWVKERKGIQLNTDAGPMLKRFKFVTLESVPRAFSRFLKTYKGINILTALDEEYILNPAENEEKELNKRAMVEVRVCEIKEQPAQKKTSSKNGTRKRDDKKKLAMKETQEEHWKNAEVQNSSLKRAEGKAISLGVEYGRLFLLMLLER